MQVQCTQSPQGDYFYVKGGTVGRFREPSQAKPRRKVESGDPGVAPRRYSRDSVFPSIFGPRSDSLPSLDDLTVFRPEGAKNTGYAWLSPATA